MEVYGTDKNFLAIGPEHSSLELSSIAIVSAPYEHTVSYGAGTKKGPKGPFLIFKIFLINPNFLRI